MPDRHVAPERVVELGDAYAATTVNTAVYRRHGLVTRRGSQFAAFYDSPRALRIVRRSLADDALEEHVLPGEYNVADGHNVAALGVDPAGGLHLAYDHHGHPLRYRRSTRPMSVAGWSEPLAMTGEREEKVTYPQFLHWPAGQDDPEGTAGVAFLYRDGAAGCGDMGLKVFDARRGAWSDRGPGIVQGRAQAPWTCNPYWNQPAFDPAGNLLLTWTWRVQRGGPPDRAFWYNHHVGYAATADGRRFFSSRGLELSPPLTPVNAESVLATTPGCNLINQCASACDGAGRLHVLYYSGEGLDDPPQYQHLWWDGTAWRRQPITARDEPFFLQGGGTLRVPISRPEAVIDGADRLYVIYRGDLTGDRLVAQRLDPPDYAPPGETHLLWDEALGHAEPIIDRVRWARDGVLSVFVQHNEQPDGDDTDPPARTAPARIAEWRLP